MLCWFSICLHDLFTLIIILELTFTINIVPIPTAVIVRNNHRIPKVLSAFEHLSFVTILSLKDVSKGEER